MHGQGALQDHEFAPVLAKCWRPCAGKYYDLVCVTAGIPDRLWSYGGEAPALACRW
ncbi:hypothetical protein [Paenibacillus sp. FSL M7-0420]|uniref:hypothetical protein n=1 Tax=Paenibacillus sp. FSL M7-0420 TaxID=2921609 RepID=UPI0030F987A2